MHSLHEYVAKQLAEKLKSRKLVVWYDHHAEFAPFIAEVRGAARTSSEPSPVAVAGIETHLAEYTGSLFELRALVEPRVSGDTPESLVLYLPGCERDRRGSVLMELEKAGECWEPELKRLARNVLRERYLDAVIDGMLAPERVTYEELARASSASSSSEPPSVLKRIFHDAQGSEGLLVAWLASDARDQEIAEKKATLELVMLVRSGLGLDVAEDAALAKLRAVTLRYVLAGEFRSDLTCPAPACLEGVPTPKSKEEETSLRKVALRLRSDFADSYAVLADQIENELGLRKAKLPPGSLGAIDTFQFEERALLTHCGDLIVNGKYEDALGIVSAREHSFWLDRNPVRKAQWDACRRMAELGSLTVEVRAAVSKTSGDAKAWIDAYTAPDGWYRLDQVQRRLEALVADLEEEPAERPLAVVRRAYEDLCHEMADGFSKAFAKAGWTNPASLHQTKIFSDVVADRPKPVAYFLVDAMRFEMGVELADRLPKVAEVSVRHAVAALPSITPIGMAALLPGAAGSFTVVQQGKDLGVRIGDAFLPDSAARRKFAAAAVPKLIHIGLDDLLRLPQSKLAKRFEDASVVVVNSQEIDHAGEAGFSFQARQVMDTVIDNLARAIRKLASMGVEHAVVTADHGHLFFANDRDDSMRIEAPGGDTVDLHRRCWIGRGGAKRSGCVRVAASELGYASDLEFVFPHGSGVFKAGGDLTFHHGGPSLQELIIPVVSIRLKNRPSTPPKSSLIQVSGLPAEITNRMVVITLAGTIDCDVVPLLLDQGKKVGGLFGVSGGASYDRDTGVVRLQGGSPISVVLQLSDDSAKSARVVLADPATDAELYRSPTDIPIRLGV